MLEVKKQREFSAIKTFVSGRRFPLMEVSNASGCVGRAGLLLHILSARSVSDHFTASSFHGAFGASPSLLFLETGTLQRHLHANYRQMYTHPFVCRDYTFNLRPWNEQKRFLFFFSPSTSSLFYAVREVFV